MNNSTSSSTRGGFHRRSMYVSKSDNLNQIVSRQSGLRSDRGTFGGNVRFSAKKLMSPTGKDSPWEDKFFKSNRFWKDDLEEALQKKPTFGFGSRPSYVRGAPNLGPGTYTPITSVAKTSSSLDGKKYCNVTIKQKTKVTVGAVSPHEEARKPGPGTYTLHSEINGGYVSRGDKKNWVGPPAPKMGIALREVHDYQGDALYNVAQDLGSSLMYFKDPKKSSTFGFAKLGDPYPSQSPDGELYYSHVKLLDDYTKVGRASGLGKGERGVLIQEQTTAGPASYYPVTSCAKTTSPLDGFTTRNLSPVTQFGKISSLKMKSMTSVSPTK
mmetsp:Transcript_16659/g.41239  ORF Transcript_16659/g.41239 Transcript_16659/m.41239 type:complete len:326 (+) Transcript_16659:148-1125(+)|eukprot:CAMPEP_0178999984 /NCGR_PEP_ID=MMETSP0795-20121207/10400_1 /TAXON_ID=88552 /ORGANISM="Amoebophrya sp., Strain Ameob2" /LENGTH=325 /DNA_ID=CAMNT_0020692891 /DNA_START=88 /DNA_END=1065 /DNA_ORIENTATION=-